MAREPDRALFLALAALYEATEALTAGPLAPSLSIRGLLALLHPRSDGRREPYTAFWARCVWPGDGEHGNGYMRSTYPTGNSFSSSSFDSAGHSPPC